MFVNATDEYEKDRANVKKCAELWKMLCELNNLHWKVEEDLQIMEFAVGQKLIK